MEFIGVGIPGESPNQIDGFKKNYGVTYDTWIDQNSNYQKLVEPGGRSFPLQVIVVNGVVEYLASYYNLEELKGAIKSALNQL